MRDVRDEGCCGTLAARLGGRVVGGTVIAIGLLSTVCVVLACKHAPVTHPASTRHQVKHSQGWKRGEERGKRIKWGERRVAPWPLYCCPPYCSEPPYPPP